MPPPALLSPKTRTSVTEIPPSPAPFVAVIVPRLTIPPESVVTSEILTPVLPAAMMPLLVMPPALAAPNAATLLTFMPLLNVDAILPLLLMPPGRS